MPVIIPISGIISKYEYEEELNVTPNSLRKSLEAANGEDVLITINSPGGSVFPGLEMFSLIKNYSGNVETKIVSLSASMGSILALAGNKKTAENTALYFVHNAQGYGMGDYRDLEKDAKFLKDVSVLLANLYAEYTPLSLKEARDFMDDDTQFFGNDLELLGFEIVKAENEVNQSQARIDAKIRFKEVENKLSKEKIDEDYMEKVAAMCTSDIYKKFSNDLKNEQNPAQNNTRDKNNNLEDHMPQKSLKEILNDDPAAKNEYDADLKAKYEAGVNDGKDELTNKINKVVNFLNNEDYPSQIKNVALDVLKGEKTIETFDSMVAGADMFLELQKSEAAKNETENAGDTERHDLKPAPEDGSCETNEDFDAMIAEEKKKAGLGA